LKNFHKQTERERAREVERERSSGTVCVFGVSERRRGGRRAQIRRKGDRMSSFLSCKANSRGELFDRAAVAAAAAAASSAAATAATNKNNNKASSH